MITYNTIKEIYSRNSGSMQLFKRDYYNHLVYTDGIMDFQNTLNAFWVVDNVISYMSEVLKTYKETQDTFFIVKISVKQDKSGYMEVYHEGYIKNDYYEHISVIKQDIPFIDFPLNPDEEITTCKFYLILSNYEPLQFTFMLTSEY